MSRWRPCKRLDFIKRLRKLGFDGPYSGTRHQFMVFGDHRLSIPSNQEYSVPQLRMMIHEVELLTNRTLKFNEWNRLLVTHKLSYYCRPLLDISCMGT